GRREEAVLEVVDAEPRGFAIGHGTQVSGELHAALVALVERSAQLVARDVHESLERRRARLVPERDQLARVVRARDLVHLRQVEPRTLKVRRRGVDPRAGALTAVDRLLDLDLAVAVHGAGGPHRRHATGEIQARETLAEIAVDAGASWVVEMLVYHHEAGNHGLTREVHDRGACRKLGA